jgi:membrane protein DedA with SNARE-associated domain
MCGAVRISFSRFLIIDAFAALITTPVMMGIGYVFAHNYDQILYYLDKVKFVLVAAGICVAAVVVYRYKRPSI